MPTITLTGRNVTLTSSWTYAQTATPTIDGPSYSYSTPTTVTDGITFDFSSIPVGAIIDSARFSSSSWGSGSTKRINGGGVSFSSSGDIPVSSIVPGGTLRFLFTYKASGGYAGSGISGTLSTSAGWTNITLTISYTEPLTAPSFPTEVSVSPSIAFPEQTVVLSWSGASDGVNNPITGYLIYKATASSGEYVAWKTIETTETFASYSFTAPSDGTSFYKISTLGTVSNSSLSSAYATLSIDLSTTSDFTLSATAIDAGKLLSLTIASVKESAHTVTFDFGEYEQIIELDAGVANTSFVIPLEWLNAIPNAVSGELKVSVKTEGGGVKTQKVVLRCPEDIVPIIGETTITRLDGTVPSDWGIYVAGFSKARAAIESPAEPRYSSPIVSYQIICGGSLVEFDTVPNGMTTDYLSGGTQTVIFSATDSRGRMGQKTVTIEVYPYVNPFLTNIISLRANIDGVEDDEGLYATCSATLNFASLDGKNTASCAVSYRPQGGDEWKTAGLLDGILLFGGDIALADNYEIRYTIMDAVGGTSVSYDIVTRAVREIDIMRGGGAWAIGGIANEKGALKVYGLLRVVGDAIIEGNFGFYRLVELPIDDWEGSGPYTKSITIEGMPENKLRPPTVEPQNSADMTIAELEDEAWANIYHVEVEGETLTFYAYEQPTRVLRLHVKVD